MGNFELSGETSWMNWFFNPLLNGLKQRINKEILIEWNSLIKKQDWKLLTKSLLVNHYDPSYLINYKRKNQNILKNFYLKKVSRNEIKILAEKILSL